MWEAKVIEHSIREDGTKELPTFQLRYPRIIHAEAKTHRVMSNSGEEYETVILTQDAGFMSDSNLSRNASSSRAIPVAKMIEQVRNNPAMPVHWGKNQPGMQAREELTGAELMTAKQAWRDAAFYAAQQSEIMMNAGLHKQVSNRPLEPYQWISVIVSATELDNFYELRDHEAADPNIFHLAGLMKAAQAASKPDVRGDDPADAFNWHLPYITLEERLQFRTNPRYLAKLSAARCARVSYLTHDGKMPDAAKDLALYEMLVGSRPLHASPVEHQAYPGMGASVRSGNFVGWVQHRKLVEADVWGLAGEPEFLTEDADAANDPVAADAA